MPLVNSANKYARDVVAGKIDACSYIKLACKRHLNDLTWSKLKGFPYRFDRDKAEDAIGFIQKLPHTKGDWAARGELLILQPWQCFIVACIFGWVHKKTGLRKYRKAYIEVPRKNGKSPLAAAIGHLMFVEDGEFGAEVYSGATTEKQAWEVYRPARKMAMNSPDFTEFYSIEVGAKNMATLSDGSRYEPVVGQPGDGASPSCAISDEYHEHPTSAQSDTFITGMVGRKQPLWLVVTTAGSNTEGPCYELHNEAVMVLEGVMTNDALFAVIYTLDLETKDARGNKIPGDDWTTIAALKKANPNYGVSVDADNIRAEQLEAVQSAYKQNTFKTKHLNIWCSAKAAWMNMEKWLACGDSSMNESDFAGKHCMIGLDVASKHDISSKIKLFTETIDGVEHYYFFGTHYVPEARAEENKSYKGWAIDRYLVLTDGEELDFERVKQDIIEDRAKFMVRNLGHDQFMAVQLAQDVQRAGVRAVQIPQTVKSFSDPMKWIFAHVLSGRLHHDNNPVMNWMMSNVVAKEDANDNIFPRKEQKANKIDGPVALLMAMHLTKSQPKTQLPYVGCA